MTSFANYLHKKMREGGYTQAKLALYSGVAESTISRLLLEDRKPLPETIAKLAKALKVETEELMRAAGYLPEEEPPTFALKVDERYLDVTDIPEETRRALEKIVEEIKRERRARREAESEK